MHGATLTPGLIPLVKKGGIYYLVLAKDQFDKDFIGTAVPSSGLGGFGPAAGEPYVAPARILRFQRVDDRVVIRWPNTIAQVDPNSPQAYSANESLPNSILGVVPIAAENANGTVVIAASLFLGDVANYAASINRGADPGHAYKLDPSRTYFVNGKSFPENTLLRVSQTWASSDPNAIDNAPDARSIEVLMSYNIIAAPNDGYVPRYSDARIGYFETPRLDFARDRVDRAQTYVTRWNFAPTAAGVPSEPTRPLVMYLSNDIPVQYREPIRKAYLTWNKAFAKIGILNAVRVEQQPTDPAWDADDIRHNIVRWITTTSPQFGAEALIIADPRTGEEINVGINIDAVEGLLGRTYRYVVAPARRTGSSPATEQAFVVGFMNGLTLHESGHNFGLQHNFIGSMAYTAKDLQSLPFTQKYGIASSVMEYTPINLWPAGTPNGTYTQDVLGPYDYYAIHYGYGYIPNARTASQELPTLRLWAAKWANPMYRFASDEDTAFSSGHAIDPRVATNDLTNRPLAWCTTQMNMMHDLMGRVNQRFPAQGQSYDEARSAFLAPMRYYLRCAAYPAHTIGGEYLSRANRGDPGSTVPFTAVPRSEALYAWRLIQSELFADSAWHFNPDVLNRLTYREISSFTDGSWVYNPTPRHDVSIAELAAVAQEQTLSELFAPLKLQRLDELPIKYKKGATMSLGDLFDWSLNGIYGDIANGSFVSDGPVRRNLQMRFAKRLALIWTAPARGVPTDAQALARLTLQRVAAYASAAQRSARLDDIARAHAAALQAIAKQALDARATIAPPLAATPGP
ncbi:MAG: zinc-dependent metalloprotease [Candidatus Baltobacteraceae bacterium]